MDTSLISWNHVVLLHGPPGTGKTSLCKALAHKLAVRLGERYPAAQLIEINAHSLFSRWFSESGKLVARLFAHITELVDDEDSLVFLLIDEVESLTAARRAAVSGSEPSDAVRVVNAVLTAIDALRGRKNCMLLTTSNVSEAIDVAFIDRADIKAYIGPPSERARYDIIASCMAELMRVGVINAPVTLPSHAEAAHALEGVHRARSAALPAPAPAAAGSASAGVQVEAASAVPPEVLTTLPAAVATAVVLCEAARAADGFSGRSLRKLPLQAHAKFVRAPACSPVAFAQAIRLAVAAERAARDTL